MWSLVTLALLSAGPYPHPTPGRPAALPVQLVENRFVLTPRLESGRVVHLYSDTGGGHTILSPELVKALGLPVEHRDAGLRYFRITVDYGRGVAVFER
jgi:hypothetical protein